MDHDSIRTIQDGGVHGENWFEVLRHLAGQHCFRASSGTSIRKQCHPATQPRRYRPVRQTNGDPAPSDESNLPELRRVIPAYSLINLARRT
jgi:hypothetical protein